MRKFLGCSLGGMGEHTLVCGEETPHCMVSVAQQKSARLWGEWLRVQVPSETPAIKLCCKYELQKEKTAKEHYQSTQI